MPGSYSSSASLSSLRLPHSTPAPPCPPPRPSPPHPSLPPNDASHRGRIQLYSTVCVRDTRTHYTAQSAQSRGEKSSGNNIFCQSQFKVDKHATSQQIIASDSRATRCWGHQKEGKAAWVCVCRVLVSKQSATHTYTHLSILQAHTAASPRKHHLRTLKSNTDNVFNVKYGRESPAYISAASKTKRKTTLFGRMQRNQPRKALKKFCLSWKAPTWYVLCVYRRLYQLAYCQEEEQATAS